MPKQSYGAEMLQVLSTIFDKMDQDGDGEVTASKTQKAFVFFLVCMCNECIPKNGHRGAPVKGSVSFCSATKLQLS